MLEFLEPLIYMVICWSGGVATGMGIGTAMATDRLIRHQHKEEMS